MQIGRPHRIPGLNPFFNNHLLDNYVPRDPDALPFPEQAEISRRQRVPSNQVMEDSLPGVNQNAQRYVPHLQIDQSFMNRQSDANSSFSQPNQGKKRNFAKLLSQEAELPDSLYFPTRQEVEIRNQFKKLKLSHDVEVRGAVEEAEREVEGEKMQQQQQLLLQI